MAKPLLPKHVPNPKGGHPRVDDRRVLIGILFVLKSGCSEKTCRAKWAAVAA